MAVLGVLGRKRSGRQLQGDGSDRYAPERRLPICPTCGGALAPRQRRCSACGSRIVLGVLIHKVVGLTLMGVIAGAAGGTIVTGNLLPFLAPGSAPANAAAHVAPVATSAPTASAAATASAAPSASAGVVATAVPLPAAPAAVVSALRQLAVINDRLVVSRRDLSAQQRAGAGPAELASGLRRVAADASSAAQVLQHLRSWSGSTRLANELATFYGRLARTASASASMTNKSAYRGIVRDTLAVLDDLAGVAGRTRTLLKAASDPAAGLDGGSSGTPSAAPASPAP